MGATLNVYNLAQIGVDVDTDNVHAPLGGWRQTQNIHRDPISAQVESVVTRKGLRGLNLIAMANGPVLGGIPIPAFDLGNGVDTLFIGFGVP